MMQDREQLPSVRSAAVGAPSAMEVVEQSGNASCGSSQTKRRSVRRGGTEMFNQARRRSLLAAQDCDGIAAQAEQRQNTADSQGAAGPAELLAAAAASLPPSERHSQALLSARASRVTMTSSQITKASSTRVLKPHSMTKFTNRLI